MKIWRYLRVNSVNIEWHATLYIGMAWEKISEGEAQIILYVGLS